MNLDLCLYCTKAFNDFVSLFVALKIRRSEKPSLLKIVAQKYRRSEKSSLRAIRIRRSENSSFRKFVTPKNRRSESVAENSSLRRSKTVEHYQKVIIIY